MGEQSGGPRDVFDAGQEPRSEALSGKERYVGDGLYASFDGWYVWLRAPRENGDHKVGMEPAVFKQVLKFCEEVWKR